MHNLPRLSAWTVDPATLRHSKVVRLLDALQRNNPAMNVRQLGESVEGRSISLATIGSGARRVLLWSQMHGDEPTHTAALLELLARFLSNPAKPPVAEILTGCTLMMIPMLNPDGAERWTRHNAQGIDVNRDARAMESPEARILQAAVDEVQPHFALNLHNQNPRSAVDGSLQPAALSVLVPPLDKHASDNHVTLRAKQLASCLVQAAEPWAGGAISRYRADFMPRAFGEAMQHQGVSTVLVEAGTWLGHDACELVQLHVATILSALQAIATGALERTPTRRYEQLPLSAAHQLYDCIVRNATLFNGRGHPPFTADLGIHVSHGLQCTDDSDSSAGTIVELGDLRESAGAVTIEGEFVAMPGSIRYEPQFTPRRLPSAEHCSAMLRAGTTTILGSVDLANPDDIEALAQLPDRNVAAVNVGFIGSIEAAAPMPSVDDWKHILCAVRQWVLAVIADAAHHELAAALESLGIAVLDANEAHSLAHKCVVAGKFGVRDRGEIRPRAAADIALYHKPLTFDGRAVISPDKAAVPPNAASTSPDNVCHVFVNGVHVVHQGTIIATDAGRLLTRTEGVRQRLHGAS